MCAIQIAPGPSPGTDARTGARAGEDPGTEAAEVAIVSASVGAGHDGAASELARRLRAVGLQVSVFDFLDLLPGALGGVLRDVYAAQLRAAPASWGWLYSALARQGRLAALGVAVGRAGADRLRRALPSRVAAVVSTYPLASQALGRLVTRGLVTAPTVTYLTDLCVHPLWISPEVELHLAPHSLTALQAQRLGARRTAVTAPAVRPQFQLARSAVTGWTSERPVALVVSGSWGVGAVAEAARDLAATGLVTPVVMCGRNDRLLRTLRGCGIAALGWVDDVENVLAGCAVVVQNAGGLTAYETLAAGVPMISYRCLPGHGLDASSVLASAGLAPLVHRRADLGPTLRAILAGDAAARAAEAARMMFDAPDAAGVIARLAGRSRPAGVPAGRDRR